MFSSLIFCPQNVYNQCMPRIQSIPMPPQILKNHCSLFHFLLPDSVTGKEVMTT